MQILVCCVVVLLGKRTESKKERKLIEDEREEEKRSEIRSCLKRWGKRRLRKIELDSTPSRTNRRNSKVPT